MSVSLTYRILGSFMVKPTKLERIIFTVMMTMHKVRTKIYLSMTHKFWDSFQKILDDKPGFLMVKHVTVLKTSCDVLHRSVRIVCHLSPSCF